MEGRRSRIGTELVPLVLILASLAGSLMLIVSVHRRFASRRPPKLTEAVAIAPTLPIPASPKPIPAPSPIAVEADEPEPPAPPTPEDPTPKALAKLTSAEAEQLLEASKADRKAAALEEARKAALDESERWRRRESLVRLQLDSLDTKVRKLENEVDVLALERDALEKERDARKALAAQNRSRPGQAILPHRGVNGTWRRPIVVECSNGMAILQPRGIGFGLMDLESGFGPRSNPFVAAVANEAIRIQGNTSPDGQQVIPYIFFLVRPDGIRAYYEARGRLEPLGITFGYELADQDWKVDFPDLDDVKTWDGSAPTRPDGLDPLAQLPSKPTGGNAAEDDDFPSLGGSRRGAMTSRDGSNGGEFTWPPRSRTNTGSGGGTGLGNLMGGSSGIGPGPGGNLPGSTVSGSGTLPGDPSGTSDGLAGSPNGPGRPAGVASGPVRGGSGSPPGMIGSKPASPSPSGMPGELALGNGPVTPLIPVDPSSGGPVGPKTNGGSVRPAARQKGQGSGDLNAGTTPGRSGMPGSGNLPPSGPDPTVGPGDRDQNPQADPANTLIWPPKSKPGDGNGQGNPSSPSATNDGTDPLAGQGDGGQRPQGTSKPDPANTLVWPPSPATGGRRGQGGPSGRTAGSDATDPGSTDSSPPVRHVGPFSRPLAMGIDSMNTSNAPVTSNASTDGDPTQPDGLVGGGIAGSRTQASASGGPSGMPGSSGSQANSQVIGQSSASGGQPPTGSPPPPGSVGLGMPGMPPDMPQNLPPLDMPPPKTSSDSMPKLPDLSRPSVAGRRMEIVVVCSARGVIVQPGGYRVTSDALKDRDGLMKKQMVALVKARRTAEPKAVIEPRVRFLVQPGGESTYWSARSQFLLSGLDWPMTLQVADPDHLAILPSESW